MTAQIGFIGLGAMGIEMAQNLQKHLVKTGSLPLMYYNRTASRGLPLKELGAIESTIAEISSKCDIVFTTLSNDEAVESVVQELTTQPLNGTILVDCSTVSPETDTKLAKLVSDKGGKFIASPVFGPTPVARAGTLIFVVAGDKDCKDQITPYIQNVMGKKVMYLGEDHAKAAMMKLSGNSFILSMMEVVAEAHVMAETVGISPEFMTEWSQAYAGDTVGIYFGKNSNGSYDPAPGQQPMFSAANANKDIDHALELAAAHNTDLPTLKRVQQNLSKAKAIKQKGYEELDVGSVYGVIRHEAGLGFENEAVKKI